MTDNRFRVVGLAKGVTLEKLYDFYTDYSPEDVSIMKKHGMTMALERVAERSGDHVIVETTARIMGMTKKTKYDIVLHPEEYWYEMELDISGFVNTRRTYKFESVTEGTRITIEDSYQPTSWFSSLLNMLGMLKKRLVNDTTKTMGAFIAEAEERFGSQRLNRDRSYARQKNKVGQMRELDDIYRGRR